MDNGPLHLVRCSSAHKVTGALCSVHLIRFFWPFFDWRFLDERSILVHVKMAWLNGSATMVLGLSVVLRSFWGLRLAWVQDKMNVL